MKIGIWISIFTIFSTILNPSKTEDDLIIEGFNYINSKPVLFILRMEEYQK